MLTYRLKNTLIPSEETDWKHLVTDSLGESIHPKRVQGFCLAREALRSCMSEHEIHLGVKELVLENYSSVKGISSLTVSLSHSSEWGAAVVAPKNLIRSVGIDIEPLSRIVKSMVVERISHPQDLDVGPLSLWTLKEAIFKALMNTGEFDRPIEFSSIQIGDEKWSHDSGLLGEWKLAGPEGLVLALAWIKI